MVEVLVQARPLTFDLLAAAAPAARGCTFPKSDRPHASQTEPALPGRDSRIHFPGAPTTTSVPLSLQLLATYHLPFAPSLTTAFATSSTGTSPEVMRSMSSCAAQ
jgi:hypothetical protein